MSKIDDLPGQLGHVERSGLEGQQERSACERTANGETAHFTSYQLLLRLTLGSKLHLRRLRHCVLISHRKVGPFFKIQ